MDGSQHPAGAGQQENPELDRILRELGAFSQTQQNQQNGQIRTPSAPAPSASTIPLSQRPMPEAAISAPPPAPMIDPATIFEWREGLRCVDKMRSKNPRFATVIKNLMSDQERNVRQWWTARNEMIQNQKTRRGQIKDMNDLLRRIGGTLEKEPTDEDDIAQLADYDGKIYELTKQMEQHHSNEFKRLGVPFFGVDPKHIIKNELQQTVAARDPLSQAKITEVELRDLQKRMIDYLEDLYGDD